MAAKLPYVVAVLAVSAAVATLMLDRAPLQNANTVVSPGASEDAQPPQDFAAQFLAERSQALTKEAREQALTSAREDEHERWEDMKHRQIVAAREARPPLAWQQMQFVEQRAQLYESESVDRDWAPRAERTPDRGPGRRRAAADRGAAANVPAADRESGRHSCHGVVPRTKIESPIAAEGES